MFDFINGLSFIQFANLNLLIINEQLITPIIKRNKSQKPIKKQRLHSIGQHKYIYNRTMKNDFQKKQPFFTPYSSSTSSQGYCNICYTKFDLLDSKPLLVCINDHCICKACLITILKRPRCPFCRGHIDAHKIRVNRYAIELINGQKRGNVSRKIFIKTVQNQQIITQSTANEREIVEYIDPQQLIEDQSELSSGQGRERAFRVVLLLQLILLQLPFGALSIMTVMQTHQNACFDHSLGSMDATLRSTLFTQGYIQFLIGTLSIYFFMMNCTILLVDGLYCCYFLLLLATIIKSSFCIILFHWMFSERYFQTCSQTIHNYSLACLVANYIALILGLFLMVVACVYQFYQIAIWNRDAQIEDSFF